MSYIVSQENVLGISAQAAVISVENAMEAAVGAVSQGLTQAGGPELRRAMEALRFLPVGSAAAVEPGQLPFSKVLLTAAPHWLTGKANELLILHRCYESLFDLAENLGIESLVMPFLSALYYRFPKDVAVHIAKKEAASRDLQVVFAAETPELYTLSRQLYRRPEIVSYVGYYRDHAIFALDNGLFARVDLRPEREEADFIPYFEACYRRGNNPLQAELPKAEVDRLRRIYEQTEW